MTSLETVSEEATSSTPLERVGDDWELHRDGDGNTYWWNNKTGETSWDPPKEKETSLEKKIPTIKRKKSTPRASDRNIPIPQSPKGSARSLQVSKGDTPRARDAGIPTPKASQNNSNKPPLPLSPSKRAIAIARSDRSRSPSRRSKSGSPRYRIQKSKGEQYADVREMIALSRATAHAAMGGVEAPLLSDIRAQIAAAAAAAAVAKKKKKSKKKKDTTLLPGTNSMENFLKAQQEAEERKTDKSFGSHHFHRLSPIQQYQMAVAERNSKENNISMSKNGFLYMDKRERLELERKRRLSFRKEKKERIDREKREIKEAIWRKWEEHIIEAKRTNALNATWKNFRVIHPKVWELEKLTVMRLLGNSLSELPRRIGVMLPSLTILSLANNGLLFLPKSIGKLTKLTDINLNNNRLKALPDSMSNLVNIININATKNYLKELPKGIGNWKLVKRLNLSKNELERVPRSMKEMCVETLLLNDNRFTHIPLTLLHMQSLTELKINKNGLVELPQEISVMTNLRKLQACNNCIMDFPEPMYKLPNLESVWLDWNGISFISDEFRLFTSCKELKLEGNPMRMPTPELAVRGPEAIRDWASGNVRRIDRKGYRGIIELLQYLFRTLLDTAEEYGTIHLGLLRELGTKDQEHLKGPGHEYFNKHGTPDAYYAFQFKELSSAYIPAFDALPEEVRKFRTWRQIFPYSRQQLREALENYIDSAGTKAIAWGHGNDQNEKIFFHKCDCRDPNDPSKRKPCTPPYENFMCSRTADLLKIELATVESEEARKMAREEEIRTKEELLDTETKARALSFESPYIDKFISMGRQQANEIFEAEAKAKWIALELKGMEKIYAEETQINNKNRIKLEKQRDKTIKKLERKRDRLKLKMDAANEFELEVLEEELKELENKIENPKEEEELEKLEIEASERRKEYKKKKAEVESLWQGRDPMQIRLDETKKRFQDLAHDKRENLRNKFINREIERRKKSLEREYRLLRKVAYNWKYAGVRMTFWRWKTWTKRRLETRIHLAKIKRKREILREDAKKARENLIQSERAKWKQMVDPITDEVFFIHKETGEEVWEIPIRDFGVKAPGL